jgi:hypothetical protein
VSNTRAEPDIRRCGIPSRANSGVDEPQVEVRVVNHELRVANELHEFVRDIPEPGLPRKGTRR